MPSYAIKPALILAAGLLAIGPCVAQSQQKPEAATPAFEVATVRETRDAPGFALVEAKHGARLQPTRGAKFPNYHVELHAGKINLRNSTLNDIAASITSVIDRPVLNQTNIQGSYDIDLTYAPDDVTDSALPSLFTAIEETIGLRLTPQKVPVEVLILDSVDSTPTPN